MGEKRVYVNTRDSPLPVHNINEVAVRTYIFIEKLIVCHFLMLFDCLVNKRACKLYIVLAMKALWPNNTTTK